MKNQIELWKKIVKNTIQIVLSVIIGYLIYYFIFMDIIPLFISTSGIIYIPISIACLIVCIVGVMVIINLIINKTINKYLFIIISVAYFCVLLLALFLRSSVLERIFILNPLTGLIDTFSDSQMTLQSLMNVIIFIPIGYFVRKLKYYQTLIFSLILSVAIELIQVLLIRGFFDTFDIILYCIGISLGYLIFKKCKFTIK